MHIVPLYDRIPLKSNRPRDNRILCSDHHRCLGNQSSRQRIARTGHLHIQAYINNWRDFEEMYNLWRNSFASLDTGTLHIPSSDHHKNHQHNFHTSHRLYFPHNPNNVLCFCHSVNCDHCNHISLNVQRNARTHGWLNRFAILMNFLSGKNHQLDFDMRCRYTPQDTNTSLCQSPNYSLYQIERFPCRAWHLINWKIENEMNIERKKRATEIWNRFEENIEFWQSVFFLLLICRRIIKARKVNWKSNCRISDWLLHDTRECYRYRTTDENISNVL